MALITAVPFETALMVTLYLSVSDNVIVATDSSDDVHVTFAFWSVTIAFSSKLSPAFIICSVSLIANESITVTLMADECNLCPSINVLLSSVAVMFAVPLALAVMTPSESTVTIFVLSDVQLTPFKSSSDAFVNNCTVSPTAV